MQWDYLRVLREDYHLIRSQKVVYHLSQLLVLKLEDFDVHFLQCRHGPDEMGLEVYFLDSRLAAAIAAFFSCTLRHFNLKTCIVSKTTIIRPKYTKRCYWSQIIRTNTDALRSFRNLSFQTLINFAEFYTYLLVNIDNLESWI